jgi:ribonucleoside-diphosphate reductase alpha chain
VTYSPQGFAFDIFQKRYALHPTETFEEANDRVARHLASAEKGEGIAKTHRSILDMTNEGLFMFGGRIMYGSGRPRGQLLNCVSGDTDVHTRDGLIKAKDLVDKTLDILSEGGVYRQAKWYCYGEQHLYKVTLSNGDELFATAAHEWVVTKPEGGSERVTTLDLESRRIPLQPLQEMEVCGPRYELGVQHGIVFGDGTLTHEGRYSAVRLFGEKKALEKYFDAMAPRYDYRGEFLEVQKLFSWFKELPSCEDREYLRGFIAGLIATDGCVDSRGHVMLHHANEARALRIRRLAAIAGLPSTSLKMSRRLNPWTGKEAPVWKLSFVKSGFTPSGSGMLLKSSHVEKYMNSPHVQKRSSVKVQKVETTGRVEPVYCCVEPQTHTMVIGPGYLTGQCFVVPTEDSREGWGQTASDVLVISGTGGGVGVNCSPVRSRGSAIHGTGGIATGAVSLMRIINAVGEQIKAGGGRRTALMLCLDAKHGDIQEFLEAKLDLAELNNANVSVVFSDDPEEFFKREGSGDTWRKIVVNALKSGEPGILNSYYANKMSNIWNVAPLIATNPCFGRGTLIHTRTGHFPIETLVGKTVDVWNGSSWQTVDNFRVTGTNQPMLRIEMQDGTNERVTPYHTVILEDGERLEARHLKPGQRLADSQAPVTHGDVKADAAYLKGFLVADGSSVEDRPVLFLYNGKYGCAERLIASASEIAPVLRTNVTETVAFTEEKNGRKWLAGIGSRKSELHYWATEGKKTLPDEAFAWDLQSKCAFVAGVMDGDGTVTDSDNGFSYQLSSVNRSWLLRFQALLGTLGVRSKAALGKSGGAKDFGTRGGVLAVQDLWRLTIPQRQAIRLSRTVTFSRLLSFADREPKYKQRPRRNEVISVTEDGIDAEVFCCTVEGSHSLALTNGFQWGQCGEIFLSAYDCCCLGALVLPRFIQEKATPVDGGHRDRKAIFNWDMLESAVHVAVRALDNVLTVNHYPLSAIAETCSGIRRIGLGIMGLHDMLLMLGLRYNSDEGLELVNKTLKFIKNAAYEASIELAKEKGAFPRFDADRYLKSGFIRTLKPSIRSAIKQHGIRNCALLTIAPTGTTSMVQGVTSGIEPMFAPAYRRKYRDGDELKEEVVIHPLFKQFVEEGRDVSHFQGAHELSMRDHFEMQRVCQGHIDNAVSKTINVPAGTSADELSELYQEYLPHLKGVTVYPDGSRENQPLTPMPLNEALAHVGAQNVEAFGRDTCRDGKCEI